MSFYRRCLPHWHPPASRFFITFRLHGSRPHCPGGPLWLQDPLVAVIVSTEIQASLRRGEIAELLAWVVMPNHVHLLLKPEGDLTPVLRRIKGASARKSNLHLGRTGRFWLEESFDHWVRDDRECQRLSNYIEQNPVSAGLAAAPGQWPWSSASWNTCPAT